MQYHTPVLLIESLEYLALRPGSVAIDATVGDGGHSERILQAIGLTGRLLALDASPTSIARARTRLAAYAEQLTIIHANFSELGSVAPAHGFTSVDGVLFDLGIASWQLGLDSDQPLDGARGQAVPGLSFQRNEPLDMRLDPRRPMTAAQIVNRSRPAVLMNLFERYGDLRRAKPLVDRIVAERKQRPIETTSDLTAIVGTRSPKALAPIFQALRIAVNEELTVLAEALDAAIALLKPGGRLVVLSYHSGEDRVVKQRLRSLAAAGRIDPLTDHPITPSPLERRVNPRSRSAKLRAARALPTNQTPHRPTV